MSTNRAAFFSRLSHLLAAASAAVVLSVASPAWSQIVLQLGGDGAANLQGTLTVQDGKLQMPILVQGGGGGWAGGGQAWQDYQAWNVPGFSALSQELVRKELDLVPEQTEEIKKLAKDFQTKLKDVYAPLQNRELPAEERLKIYQEVQQRITELNKEADQQVRKILLPQQVKVLETAELRNRIAGMLQYGVALERAGLSDEQRKQMAKNRAELAEKMYQLQKEAFEDALKILTPEQIDKLKMPMYAGQQPGGNPKK